MMQNRTPANRKNRKILLYAGAALAVSAIAFTAGKKTDTSSFLSFEGSGANTLSATLQSTGKTVELSGDNARFDLPETEKLFAPYALSSSVFSGTHAQDFSFKVSATGKIDVLADGFGAEDKVTLTFNGDKIFKDVPMDWSGRIELTSDLPAGEDVEACISVETRGVAVCHHIPKGIKA